jgi:ElaB/YqjD/DUF883 family membrane-anchored ribosome-binding protein
MITDSSNGSSLGEVVQSNGIPLALIGVGIAWMVANNTGLAQRFANDERLLAARRRVGDLVTDLGIGGTKPESGGDAAPILGPDGEPLYRTAAARSNGWVHQAADAAKGAISSVREAGSAVLDRATRYTDYTGDAGGLAKRASGQVAEKLQQSDPWLIGIAGLVAGALVAAILPPTRIEREYIGEARDGLRNRATELGHEAAERVRELADSTTHPDHR